jgi:hypothetical protein
MWGLGELKQSLVDGIFVDHQLVLAGLVRLRSIFRICFKIPSLAVHLIDDFKQSRPTATNTKPITLVPNKESIFSRKPLIKKFLKGVF